MKTLILIPVIALATFSFTPTVQASSMGQKICDYVAVDDKSRLRSFLKNNKLKIRNVFDSVECNGKNLVEFADGKKSFKTGSLMISKLPKDKVKNIMASINSSELSSIANKRVNG